MKPRVPGTLVARSDPPVCAHCCKTFLQGFQRVNASLPSEQRLTEQQLLLKAVFRARAVRFRKQWVCPRCTTIPDVGGGSILFDKAYPNRAWRRRGEKADKQTGKRRRQAA